MLTGLDGIGETSATTLVAEVYHRVFPTRRHVAAYMGLAPSPYASGAVSRDRGISKAGSKLARTTVVELAWFWLRYQPASKLARWWHERFATRECVAARSASLPWRASLPSPCGGFLNTAWCPKERR